MDKIERSISIVLKLVESDEPYGDEGQYQLVLRQLDYAIHENLGTFESLAPGCDHLAEIEAELLRLSAEQARS